MPLVKTRVLIVEGESFLREIMVDALTHAGFEVDQAVTDDEAARLLDADGYSLVLIDRNMPGKLDGIAVAAFARDRHPGTPIMFVSRHAEVLPNGKGSRTRTATLPKLYLPSQLIAKIQYLLSDEAE